MRRFFVDLKNVGASNIIIDNKEDVHHIWDVLRLVSGDKIMVSDSYNWEYTCEIMGISDSYVEAKILDKQKIAGEPEVKITLFQGVPKQGKMDLVVQKTTELGISAIVPVFMARTVVQDKGAFWKKLVRQRSIAKEASKQCGRGVIPEIRKETDFENMIDGLHRFDLVIFPYENEEDKTIKDVLRNLKEKPLEVAIIVGPEGGFADEEANKLKAAGTKVVSLGKTTLRTETACIVATAMCMYELEL